MPFHESGLDLVPAARMRTLPWWKSERVEALIVRALAPEGLIGKGRRLSLGSELLQLKRPRLVSTLHSYVV
jgi:hypothetical protein